MPDAAPTLGLIQRSMSWIVTLSRVTYELGVHEGYSALTKSPSSPPVRQAW